MSTTARKYGFSGIMSPKPANGNTTLQYIVDDLYGNIEKSLKSNRFRHKIHTTTILLDLTDGSERYETEVKGLDECSFFPQGKDQGTSELKQTI